MNDETSKGRAVPQGRLARLGARVEGAALVLGEARRLGEPLAFRNGSYAVTV